MRKVMTVFIIMLFIGMFSLHNIHAYNMHDKVEAEKEYDRLTKLIDNIEEALRDIDKIKEKPISTSGDITANTILTTSATWSITLDGGGWGDHIEVKICEGVANLIRTELKILLQIHLDRLKFKRKAINVK